MILRVAWLVWVNLELAVLMVFAVLALELTVLALVTKGHLDVGLCLQEEVFGGWLLLLLLSGLSFDSETSGRLPRLFSQDVATCEFGFA